MMKTVNRKWIYAVMFLSVACGRGNGNYDAAGVFEATEIVVGSEASGKLVGFCVEEGMKLDSGQVVGLVDTVQLYLKKEQLLANAGAALSRRADITRQIAGIRQQIETARYEKNRLENLLKANAANRKQLDDMEAQIAVLEKELAAQQSVLENNNRGLSEDSRALLFQVEQLEDQLRKCRVTAPVGGTVLAKYTEQGELAAQGKALFKMADIEQMFLRAYVLSPQLSQLKIGQEVTVAADYGEATPRTYRGTVTWISDKAEFTPKTIQTKDERANLVYAVKIALKNDGFLKIGMYGEMTINGQQ